MRNKVVITGMGVISAIGNNVEENLISLQQNRSGVSPVKYLNTSHKDSLVGEVKMSNEEMCHELAIDDTAVWSRSELLGVWATHEAIGSAFQDVKGLAHECCAFVNGTTVAGMDITEKAYPDNITAQILDNHDCGGCTEKIAHFFKNSDKTALFDKTITLSTACSSALNAIIRGVRMVEAGETDVTVCGGTEALSVFHLNGFKSLMILDEQRCRPFDASRQGLNLGEGAAYLVVETEEHALARGAKILATFSGAGNACDAFHSTATSENGEGAFRAMTFALNDAHLAAQDIHYINAHGTGTINNDNSESYAIKRVFHDHAPLFSSTKAFTGHATSAAGAIEAVFSILSLVHNFIPVNLGWERPCYRCYEPYMGGSHAEVKHVMCNSFAFGGNDSSIILSAYSKKEACKSNIDALYEEYRTIELMGEKIRLPKRVKLFHVTEAVEDGEIREYISPMKTRRYSHMLKRALATALKCCRDSGILVPDVIINATSLGNIQDSVKILQQLKSEGEDAMYPALFTLSTHNSAATLLAMELHCHGYNNTYSHRAQSLEQAISDACEQLLSGRAMNALVTLNDEVTSEYVSIMNKECYSPDYKTDVSVAYMFTLED